MSEINFDRLVAGLHCEIEINECESNPCYNDATCTDLLPGYNCSCADGFEGMTSPRPSDAVSIDLLTIADGYVSADSFDINNILTGNSCELEIDDCEMSECVNNATCVDAFMNYTCACVDGFTGNIAFVFELSYVGIV